MYDHLKLELQLSIYMYMDGIGNDEEIRHTHTPAAPTQRENE